MLYMTCMESLNNPTQILDINRIQEIHSIKYTIDTKLIDLCHILDKHHIDYRINEHYIIDEYNIDFDCSVSYYKYIVEVSNKHLTYELMNELRQECFEVRLVQIQYTNDFCLVILFENVNGGY